MGLVFACPGSGGGRGEAQGGGRRPGGLAATTPAAYSCFAILESEPPLLREDFRCSNREELRIDGGRSFEARGLVRSSSSSFLDHPRFSVGIGHSHASCGVGVSMAFDVRLSWTTSTGPLCLLGWTTSTSPLCLLGWDQRVDGGRSLEGRASELSSSSHLRSTSNVRIPPRAKLVHGIGGILVAVEVRLHSTSAVA